MATPFSIVSLRGGMNDEDPSHSLPDDMVVMAENAEFHLSTLGERRLGMAALSLVGSTLGAGHEIVHLTNHLPLASKILNTELWAVSATVGSGTIIEKKSAAGVWTVITPFNATDSPTPTSPDIYQLDSKSTDGQLFVCYKSAVARMHVWDGTLLRRVGLAPPMGAPVAANSGTPGGLSTTIGVAPRTYRVRFVRMTGAVVNLLSEPSPEVVFTPAGTDDAVVVTRPGVVDGVETHWDLEASDGSNFYRIARTVIGTTTANDTVYDFTDYGDFDLSESVGDYTVLPSARFVKNDQDHLLFFGDYEDPTKDGDLGWSVARGASGFGNIERQPTRYDSFLPLGKLGGEPTGLSDPMLGAFYAFKWSAIFKVNRTQDNTEAYEALLVSDQHGALPGSVVNGVDEFGHACIYFLNPSTGPMRLSTQGGLQQMKGINTTWQSVNTAATKVVCHGVYLPNEQQVKWWVATDSENTPNFVVVLQTDEVRATSEGTSRGWSIATGTYAFALCSTVIPESHVDADTGATSLKYRLYLGFKAPLLIQKAGVGDDDNGDSYEALIRTKPYMPAGLLGKFEVNMGALLAVPVTSPGVKMDVTLIRNFGKHKLKDIKTVPVDFSPDGDEELKIILLDSLKMGEATVLQFEFSDHDNPVGGRWELHRFDVGENKHGGLLG